MDIKVKFTLLNGASNKPTSIRLHFYYGKGKKFKYGTGKTILPTLWDNSTQRPTKKRTVIKSYLSTIPNLKTELRNVGTRLSNLDNEVHKFFAYCQLQGIEPTNEKIREHLDGEVKKLVKEAPKRKEETLNQFVNRYVTEMENGTRRIRSGHNETKNYSKGTIKNYKGFAVQFTEYQTETRRKINFDDVTIDFYDDYVNFFVAKDYSPNTIGRHIKNLKVIMQAAKDEGLHQNSQFRQKKFKTITAETESIYLTDAELKRLRELDLSAKPHYKLVRDVFLVGCYTALRYSDYSRIKPEHIKTTAKGNKVIDIIPIKTGKKVIIPIRPELDQILQEYNYYLPKTHEQKVNSRIKEIGAWAKITNSTQIEKIKGGLKVKMNIPKNELIMTHTARRTGATLMYLARIPVISIMKITGHSTERNFMKYIKVTKEETADILANHPFFRPSPLKIAQ